MGDEDERDGAQRGASRHADQHEQLRSHGKGLRLRRQGNVIDGAVLPDARSSSWSSTSALYISLQILTTSRLEGVQTCTYKNYNLH